MKKIIKLTASLILATSLLTSCNNTSNQKVENNEVKKELSNPAEIIKKDDEKNIILTKKDKNIFYWNTQITTDWDTNLEDEKNNFDRAWEKFIAYDIIWNYKSFALYEKTSGNLNAWMWSFTLFSYDWINTQNINNIILKSLWLENTGWSDILISKSNFTKSEIKEDKTWVYIDFEFQTWIKEFSWLNLESWEMDIPALYLDETKKFWSEFQIIKKSDKLKEETWVLRFYFSKI